MRLNSWALLIFLLPHRGISQPGYRHIKISDDIELVRLSENAYLHVSTSFISGYGRVASNGLIYTNGHKAFLFDTPVAESQTLKLLDFVEDSLKLKIIGFVPNHWHSDCMGGLKVIQKRKIDSWANRMTIDIARTKNLPVPAHGFRDSLSLDLGGKRIFCYYPGPAHTLDNIVVWIPSEKILFAGCMVKSLDSQNLGNTADGDLKSYPATLARLITKFPDAKIVIPGHGNPGGIELVIHTEELLRKTKQ